MRLPRLTLVLWLIAAPLHAADTPPSAPPLPPPTAPVPPGRPVFVRIVPPPGAPVAHKPDPARAGIDAALHAMRHVGWFSLYVVMALLASALIGGATALAVTGLRRLRDRRDA